MGQDLLVNHLITNYGDFAHFAILVILLAECVDFSMLSYYVLIANELETEVSLLKILRYLLCPGVECGAIRLV